MTDEVAGLSTRMTDKAFKLPLTPLEMALAFPDEKGRALLEPYMQKARARTSAKLAELVDDDRELDDAEVLFEVMLEREISDAKHAERLAEAVREAFERGRAEGTANEERKRAWVAEDYKKLQAELAEAKSKLFAVKADKDDVWFWQKHDENEPETLTCPIVMWPETLIEIRKQAAAEARAEVERGRAAENRIDPAPEGVSYVSSKRVLELPASAFARLELPPMGGTVVCVDGDEPRRVIVMPVEDWEDMDE